MSFLPTPYGVRRNGSYVCYWVSFPFLRKLNERYSNKTKIKQLDFPKIFPHKTLSRGHKKRSYTASCLRSSFLLFLDHFLPYNCFRMFHLSFPTNNDDDIPIHSKVKEKGSARCDALYKNFQTAKDLPIRQALKNLSGSLYRLKLFCAEFSPLGRGLGDWS